MQTRDPNGLLLVISGPSGVGKTTIVHEVRRLLDGVFSVSATTRQRTAQETDGVDYRFVTPERFHEMIERGEMLEHAQVFGRDWYGTPRDAVDEMLADGKLVILDIDVQGALQIRAARPGTLMIFILPPSDEELLRRLRDRGRDDEEAIQRRFAEAKREIGTALESGAYDAEIVNNDLADAIERTCVIIRQRRTGQTPSDPEPTLGPV